MLLLFGVCSLGVYFKKVEYDFEDVKWRIVKRISNIWSIPKNNMASSFNFSRQLVSLRMLFEGNGTGNKHGPRNDAKNVNSMVNPVSAAQHGWGGEYQTARLSWRFQDYISSFVTASAFSIPSAKPSNPSAKPRNLFVKLPKTGSYPELVYDISRCYLQVPWPPCGTHSAHQSSCEVVPNQRRL